MDPKNKQERKHLEEAFERLTELGFRPNLSLSEGYKNTWDWVVEIYYGPTIFDRVAAREESIMDSLERALAKLRIHFPELEGKI
jgi:hypothetical protein